MAEGDVFLSIVVPAYNGGRHLGETITSIAGQLQDATELVVCDDRSRDASADLVRRAQLADPRIKLFVNEKNLGMDANFEKAVGHARGEFFWFCGQDDLFMPGAIGHVLHVLRTKPVDFVYVNYGQYNDDLSAAVNQRMLTLDQDVTCRDARHFLELTDQRLPTFLPSFVLRKSLWDRVDKRRYYGTQYIQLGALLDLLPQTRTHLVAAPLVKGRIPDDGWQEDDLKAIDCLTGYLEVLTHHHAKQPELMTAALYQRSFAICWTMLIGRLSSLRAGGRSLNDKLNQRFDRIFDRRHRLIVRAMSAMPTPLFRLVRASLRVARAGIRRG